MRISKALPVLAAATLSLGLLAGCGQSASSDDVRPVSELTGESFASTIVAAVGDAGSAHVAAEGSIMGMPLSLEGDVSRDQTSRDLALGLASADGGIDIRLVDQVVYAKADPFTGGQFLRLDLTDGDDPLVAQLNAFKDKVDVEDLLADLDGAVSVEPSDADPLTIDGVETTAYVVTVDAAKLDSAGRSGRVPAESLEITIHVGADDLPRRLVTDQGGSPLTVDFSAWGEPVEVEAPAADQISDQSASDLLSGFMGAR